MKLKYEFEAMDMGDEIIAVPVGDNASELHGVIKLNKEGFEIFEMIKEGKSEEEIVAALTKKYDNDVQQLTENVRKTINTLQESGIIE